MRRRWLLAGTLPLCSLILGLVETSPDRLADTDSLFSTFMAAVCVLLVFCWYRVDAGERGYRTSWGLSVGMLLVTTIALPWYLVRSRSGVQVLIALLLATAMFVLCCLMYRVGSALAGVA
ncbi:MAG: hypothetical protein ABIQ86_15285 [Steroidobacteraceae bacterium]